MRFQCTHTIILIKMKDLSNLEYNINMRTKQVLRLIVELELYCCSTRISPPLLCYLHDHIFIPNSLRANIFNKLISIRFVDECPCLPNPINGYITGCNVTDFLGDTVEYLCKSGYYLVGANIRTCQSGGNWTGSAPTCEAGLKDKSVTPSVLL